MKTILVLIIAFFFLQNTMQILHWKAGRKHAWTDFRGYPPSGSTHSAYSTIGFEINYNLIKDTLYFKCITSFNCTASWFKKNEATPTLLKHEDLHFDISEAYGRSLKKLVKETPLTQLDYKEKLDKMIRFVQQETANYQKAYDKETNYSLIQGQQQKWNHRVFTDLLSLKNYSDSVVKVVIKK